MQGCVSVKKDENYFVQKIINYILDFFIFVFTVILLISLYINIQTKILKNPYANFFGYSMFEVQTGSMYDQINIGDWIIVKLNEKINLNDIITFESNGSYVTHRVIEIYGDTYITKGDANNSKDEPISGSSIVGKVVNILPRFGIIRKTIFNPIILLCIIVTLFLINITFKNDKDKRYNDKMELVKDYFKKIIDKIKNVFIDDANYEKNINFSKNSDVNEDKSIIERDLKLEKDEIYKENDIEKTSMFRFVKVDLNDIKSNEINELKIDDKLNREENSKTEINEKNKVDETKNKNIDTSDIIESKSSVIEKNITEKKLNEINDNLEYDENIDFKNIENSKEKKYKNVIEKVISLKIDELNELMNFFEGESYNLVNEYTIKKEFINAYIDVRYFNILDDDMVTSSKFTSKVENKIKKLGSKMLNQYTGSDAKYSDKISKYINMFMLLSNVETIWYSNVNYSVKNDKYKKALNKFYFTEELDKSSIKYLISGIVKIKKKYENLIKYLIEKLNTSDFKLNYSKINNLKNTYAVCLEQNVNFNKIYSSYIVNKTYNEGIIAEDKIIVMLSLLFNDIVYDMVNFNFNKKYMIYIPSSLYTKEKKYERILNLFNNEYCKKHISILVSISDFITYRDFIMNFKRDGYNFSIIYDSEVKILYEDYGNLYIADYIFINKDDIDISKVFAFIPEEIYSKFVFDDFSEKIDDFRRD